MTRFVAFAIDINGKALARRLGNAAENAPEQAKQMAKCIIAALSDAGLEIRLYAGSSDALPS